MSLNDIRERIVKQAEREAQKVLEEGNTQAAEIVSSAEKISKDAKQKSWDDLNSMLDNMRAKKIAGAELEAEKLVLNKKKELINEVFDAVREKVQKLDKASRKAHVEKLQEDAKKEIKVSKVFCNEADKEFVSGKAETADIIGGIIVEDESGKMSLDLSYDTLLESLREKTLKGVDSALFTE